MNGQRPRREREPMYDQADRWVLFDVIELRILHVALAARLLQGPLGDRTSRMYGQVSAELVRRGQFP